MAHLTAVINRPEIAASSDFQPVELPNLRLIRDYMSDVDIRTLQNECGVHICCSEAEGYGHYIAEAMSTGAVTLTTDGPPMNEFIQAGRGFLVAAPETAAMNVARNFLFDPASLEEVVGKLQMMSVADKEIIGDAARQWYLQNRSDFGPRFRSGLMTSL